MKLNDLQTVLGFLSSRKSGSAKAMGLPGPTRAQLDQMLRIAVRVPDHGKLSPWRFVVFAGDERAAIGRRFKERWRERNPSHGEDSLAFQAGLFERAPVVIAVVSTAAEHPKIPVWEQHMSAAAVCYNLVLAAIAMGFDAQWQTDWVAYDTHATAAMGLASQEKIAGLIYIGTATVALEDRPRPEAQSLTTYWKDT